MLLHTQFSDFFSWMIKFWSRCLASCNIASRSPGKHTDFPFHCTEEQNWHSTTPTRIPVTIEIKGIRVWFPEIWPRIQRSWESLVISHSKNARTTGEDQKTRKTRDFFRTTTYGWWPRPTDEHKKDEQSDESTAITNQPNEAGPGWRCCCFLHTKTYAILSRFPSCSTCCAWNGFSFLRNSFDSSWSGWFCDGAPIFVSMCLVTGLVNWTQLTATSFTLSLQSITVLDVTVLSLHSIFSIEEDKKIILPDLALLTTRARDVRDRCARRLHDRWSHSKSTWIQLDLKDWTLTFH